MWLCEYFYIFVFHFCFEILQYFEGLIPVTKFDFWYCFFVFVYRMVQVFAVNSVRHAASITSSGSGNGNGSGSCSQGDGVNSRAASDHRSNDSEGKQDIGMDAGNMVSHHLHGIIWRSLRKFTRQSNVVDYTLYNKNQFWMTTDNLLKTIALRFVISW